jgi:hypothetical protein
MTRLTFVAAALIAAAAYSEGAAARPNVASRHAQAPATASTAVGNCVRAPNVGAFASEPYSSPPCMPGTAN